MTGKAEDTMHMTDEEFDVLDELYFVQSFEYLLGQLDFTPSSLLEILAKLFDKGWVKCFSSMNEEIFDKDIDIKAKGATYYYLATKAGLLAHNGH
ncbi:hypothetical protein [Penaeicola halotolerans]|uniref:hypothetical protein n=1 Tax=Penaeicola halotolerans TaxID=2793196 RepID=UPI001CF8887F|nr:hypothetical protein [Penaeicola halotolerans]